MSLRSLIQAIKPNFSTKELRAMVPWFDQVSGMLTDFPGIVASANVDSAGTILKSFGFTAPVLHPGAGQYALNLTNQDYDINDLVPFANITNVGTPAGSINIYPAMSTNTQVFLNVWQLAVTTGARTAVDAEFMVYILRNP